MADPTLFTTHVSQGLKRLLVQFQGQPNFAGQLRSFLLQVQELEQVFFDLRVQRYVDNAVGAQLDGIGRVVGETRKGKNDTDYRTAIKGRILSNRANSRVEEIHALFGRLLPGFTFTWASGTVASFIYGIDQALTGSDPSPEVLNQQLQTAKGGGIHASLLHSGFDDSLGFTFATGDVPEADALRGFSNDAGSSGGHFADVV